MLQREEQKEAQLLQEKVRQDQELMEKKFEIQREVINHLEFFCHLVLLKELERKFEVRLDSMKKGQKKEIEKLETSQEAYFKSKTKKLKQEQVKGVISSWARVHSVLPQAKELKRFKDELRQEEKLVTNEAKLEMETKNLTKAERKRQLTKRLSDLYGAQGDKVWY